MKNKTLLKIFALLSKAEKKNLYILLALMMMNALVEVFGIASVAPLIALISSPDSIEAFPVLQVFYTRMQFSDLHTFSIFLGCVVFLIILFNNASMLATNYMSFRYANNREYSIGYRLLQTYLFQPYRFFLERNSNELLRNVDNEVAYVVSNIIIQFLHLLSKSLSAVAIVILIFFINPIVTIIMGAILGLAYLAVYLFMKKKLLRLGKNRFNLSEVKLRLITDSIKIIKDIKMLNAEEIFLTKFNAAGKEYAQVRTFSDFAAIAPRYVIEVFAVCALVFAVIYLVSHSENPKTVLPVLGIYAFAGYRLMPALQQIYNSISKMQFSAHSLDMIFKEVITLQDEAEKNRKFETTQLPLYKSFGIQDAWFSYGDGTNILENVTLEINKGEKIGIIGGSGEGKSTIIDLLVGLNTPQDGDLIVDGRSLSESDLAAWRANVAYVSQHVYLLDDSVDANISLENDEEKIDKNRVKQARDLALVDRFIATTNDGKAVGENGVRMSGGQRQRIGIARALYRDVDVYVFDEATSALDAKIEREVLSALEGLPNKTMLFITHRVETLRFCDVIYVVSSGNIVASGSYEDLEKSSQAFRDLTKTFDDG